MTKQFIIAAPKSNAGKTTVTLGLLRLFKRKGLKVQPFKSGPDYIDPKFHELACSQRGLNLDLFMMSKPDINSALSQNVASEINCIEGVMGLFDGANKDEGSTAELAKQIETPVVLVVDAKAVAYSVAPLIQGFKNFDSDVNIAGVIFNRVGSERHYQILKEACEDINVKSFGYLLNIPNAEIPSRHLGLTINNINQFDKAVDLIADEIEQHVHWKSILDYSKQLKPQIVNRKSTSNSIRFAVAKDEAFNFIYTQHIQAMHALGKVSYFSPLKSKQLPDADFVYFPGGYPECYAEQLSQNYPLLESIHNYAEHGGLIFAECGGMMYLGKELIDKQGKAHSMVGVFDFSTSMQHPKLNLGYRTIKMNGQIFKGHEFHYSTSLNDENSASLGSTFNARDIEVTTKLYNKKNVLASYIHFYFGNKELLQQLIHQIKSI